jgi:hypothetical protein
VSKRSATPARTRVDAAGLHWGKKGAHKQKLNQPTKNKKTHQKPDLEVGEHVGAERVAADLGNERGAGAELPGLHALVCAFAAKASRKPLAMQRLADHWQPLHIAAGGQSVRGDAWRKTSGDADLIRSMFDAPTTTTSADILNGFSFFF